MIIKKIVPMLVPISILPFTISCASTTTKYNQNNLHKYAKDVNHKFKDVSSAYKTTKKKHYIFFMMDSLTSWRLMETIAKLQKFYDEHKPGSPKAITPAQLSVVKEKLDLFNEFELKMNVTTPSFRTDKGLEGVIGGANGQFTTEYFARAHRTRLEMLNKSYDRMFKSIGMSKNIDKMYIHATSFYKYGAKYTANANWTLSDVNIPQEAKDKMDISNRVTNTKELWSADKALEAIKNIDENKNTFSLLISNIIHDSTFYTYGIGTEYRLDIPNKLFTLLVKMKRELIKKGIWDNTELMFVSDHGKDIHPGSLARFKGYKYHDEMENKELQYTRVENIANDKSDKIVKLSEKYKVFWPNFQHAQAGILYKPIHSQHKKLEIDFKNLYINSDAITQLYHDIGIDPYYLKFNYYEYTNDLRGQKNDNGDFNSWVDDPFHKDLSKRRLFTLDHPWPKTQPTWGYGYKNNISTGTLFNGPWWTKNSKGDIKFNTKNITRIRFGKKVNGISPLTSERDKAANSNKSENVLNVMGQAIDAMNLYLK